MKGQAVITRHWDKSIALAFGSPNFATSFLTKIIGECLGVKKPLERPAEYYVQKPYDSVEVKRRCVGVEFRLTGVTLAEHTPAQFHKALKVTHELVKKTIIEALKQSETTRQSPVEQVQMLCVIILDNDIETTPDSGIYSNILKSKAEWVSTE